jgi:hypothetical protein
MTTINNRSNQMPGPRGIYFRLAFDLLLVAFLVWGVVYEAGSFDRQTIAEYVLVAPVVLVILLRDGYRFLMLRRNRDRR